MWQFTCLQPKWTEEEWWLWEEYKEKDKKVKGTGGGWDCARGTCQDGGRTEAGIHALKGENQICQMKFGTNYLVITDWHLGRLDLEFGKILTHRVGICDRDILTQEQVKKNLR